MEKRETYFVSRKNALTWLAAVLMVGSVGLRIAYFCGKGADATTMWLQIVLPVVACMIFALQILLDGKEHFYRTAAPVSMMAVYFAAVIMMRGWPKRIVFLSILGYFAFVMFYRLITAGSLRAAWALPMMFLGRVGPLTLAFAVAKRQGKLKSLSGPHGEAEPRFKPRSLSPSQAHQERRWVMS